MKVEANAKLEAPPPAKVVPDVNVTLFSVDHPEQFPFVTAIEHTATSELVVTGTVNADVSRSVPVVSLATGRVVAIHARLGDTVKKGQLLLSVRSDDVANGFSDYRKAVADEMLTRKQLDRAKELYEHGAIPMSELENTQNSEDKAKVDVETLAEHLRLLGNDPEKPNGVVDIFAPVAGVITDQQVTNAAGLQGLGSSPFTISDLSHVWIVCDVYENDLPNVHIGDTAEIRLNAYPDQVLRGRVSNIGAILDPNIRTAKVRIEVPNPGMMRLGMFVKATFRGQTKEVHTAVPGIRHLAYTRPRLCLRARAGKQIPPRGSRQWRRLAGQHARDQVRNQTGPSSGHERAGPGAHHRPMTGAAGLTSDNNNKMTRNSK